MATTIKIKNSNVGGKVPAAGSLESAELALNLKDRKLYSKDADGNVFEIGNAANVPGGGTPPGSGNEIGDLFFDTVNNILLYWDGSEWLPVVDGDSIALGELSDVEVDGVVDGQVLVYDANAGNWVPASPASLAVDVDLDYTPAADKGTITNTAGDDAEIPLVDETNAGLMSPDDFKKLSEMPGFISGDTQPGNPSLGDIWIDTGDCPPTINVWDDCDDPGNPSWKPIGGGGGGGCVQGPVSIVSSNGTELGSTLTAVGGNGVDEGTGLTATYAWTGAKTASGNTVVADVEGDYTVTATIICTDGSTLSDSTVWTVSDSYVDMVNNTPPVIAVVGEGPDGAYEGNSIYVVTPATVINGINPIIVENRWFIDGSDAGTGQLYEITASDVVGEVITCRQLFRDARTNEILSDESNSITIVARPAGAITFAAVITDDGTPNANTPGHVLTASAQNIQGGTAPVEYAYEWKVDGLTMGDQKTLNIIQTFVGKIVTCDVTVAEPDGTNPETRTAVYSEVIEIAGTINTPSVLSPQDGAGSGDARYLLSDTIIDVEGGGISTCETKLIASVEGVGINSGTVTVSGWNAGNIGNVINPDGVSSKASSVNNIKGIFNFDPPLQGVTKVRAYTRMLNGGEVDLVDGDNTRVHLYTNPGEGTKWYTVYEGEPIELYRYMQEVGQSGGTKASDDFWALEINGELVRVNSATPTTTTGTYASIAGDGYIDLTFPDTTGFDCFEVGDTVQSSVGGEISNVHPLRGTFIRPDGTIANARLYGLKIDGEQLIETATEYSSRLTLDTGNWDSSNGPVNAFDADLTNFANAADGFWIFSPTTAFTGVTTIEVWAPSGLNNYRFKFEFDGQTGYSEPFPGTEGWLKVSFENSAIITDIDYGTSTITVTTGEWFGQDGSGTFGGDTELSKVIAYQTRLTVDSDKDLADMTGGTIMTDGSSGPSGAYIQTPYKLVTTDIESVDNSDPANVVLTFPGDVSTNPDLQYFLPGDVVQGLAVFPGDTYELKCDLTESGQGNPNTLKSYNDPALTKVDDVAFGTAPSQSFQSFVFYYDLDVPCKNIHVVRYAGSFPGNNTGPTFTLMGSNDANSTAWTQLVTGNSIDDGSNPSITQYISGSTPYRYLAFVHNNSPDGILTDRYGIEDTIFENNESVKVISTGYPDSNTMTVDGGAWDTSNQSQVWSNVLTSDNGFISPASDAFDNNTTTKASTNSSGTLTFTPNLTVPANSTIEMFLGKDSGSTFEMIVNVDGVENVIDGGGFLPVPYNNGTTINTITVKRANATNSAEIRGIKINGKVLIDAVEDSQVWSSYGSSDVVDGALFDGDLSTYGGGTFDYQFNTDGPTASSSIEVYFDTPNAYSNTVTINNSANLVPLTQGTQWVDVTTQVGLGQITQIIGTHSGGDATGLLGVKIDGKLMMDQGARDFGDTHVEYQTNGGQGDIVSVNTDDNTLLIANSGDRDNRWIAENKAATDFYVAGPSIVDEPLLTADVELKSTDFATTPENADTLKNIVWELNGTEQDAGVSNPYKPTLNINTTYTVRVKHQGNDLDDSEWSTATTFTTGATRNLYTYYKERVELLEARLAGIEADEIVDDATDVTLLTAFANLVERVEALEGGA